MQLKRSSKMMSRQSTVPSVRVHLMKKLTSGSSTQTSTSLMEDVDRLTQNMRSGRLRLNHFAKHQPLLSTVMTFSNLNVDGTPIDL